MVAGAHALSELPAEITTPGRGQIRAMVINSGNPVVSGPDGAKLDEALEQLDLLVAIDFVQRESHRHAHWLLPAVHWLERDDLLAFTSNMHDEPYRAVRRQGRRAAAGRPGGVADLHRPCDRDAQATVRREGSQRLHQRDAPGRAPHAAARPGVRAALDRPAGGRDSDESSTAAGSNGATSWRTRTAWCWDRGSSATSGRRCGPTTRRCTRRRRSSSQRARELLAEPHPAAPDGYPFQLAQPAPPALDELLAQRASRPASGRARSNEVVINPDDAAALGIGDGDRVRVFSPVGEIELAAAIDATARAVAWWWSTTAGAQGFSTRAAVAHRSHSAPTATCSSTADPSTRCLRPRR